MTRYISFYRFCIALLVLSQTAVLLGAEGIVRIRSSLPDGTSQFVVANPSPPLVYVAIPLKPDDGSDAGVLTPRKVTASGRVLLTKPITFSESLGDVYTAPGTIGYTWKAGVFRPLYGSPSWQIQDDFDLYYDDVPVTLHTAGLVSISDMNDAGDVIGWVGTDYDISVFGGPFEWFRRPAFWPAASSQAVAMGTGDATKVEHAEILINIAGHPPYISPRSNVQTYRSATSISALKVADDGRAFAFYEDEGRFVPGLGVAQADASAPLDAHKGLFVWPSYLAAPSLNEDKIPVSISPDGNNIINTSGVFSPSGSYRTVYNMNDVSLGYDVTGPVNNAGRFLSSASWAEDTILLQAIPELSGGSALAINGINDILGKKTDGTYGIWAWFPISKTGVAPLNGIYHQLTTQFQLPAGWELNDLAASINDSRLLVGRIKQSHDAQGNVLSVQPTVPAVFVPIGGLAVDANGDGEIRVDNSSDQVSTTNPYRFWINDDNDQSKVYTWGNSVIPNLAPPGFISPGLVPLPAFYEQEQDDQPVSGETNKNCNDLVINGTRDLEDFARLWIDASGLRNMITGANPALKIGLKWTDVSEGNPAIRLFRAAEANGSTGYLFNSTTAAQQIDQTGQSYGTALGSGMVETASTYVIPQIALANLSESQPHIRLLFEGCRSGKGQLKLVILKNDGTEIGEGPGVWMDLKKPNEFVERFSCGDDHLEDVVAVHRHSSSATFAAPTKDEEKDYVLYVHGYNMADFEKQRWIETAYKRLYWLGYKGRVGGFTWPCSQSAPPFDASEEKAWQAAAQLKTHLQNLKAQGYRVHVIAHSQGNVVMGEALRQAGSGAGLVRTYIASQAAVAASCYKENVPLMPNPGQETPDVYGTYPPTSLPYFDGSAMSGAASRYVNFYNPSDFALTSVSGNGFSWETNQRWKPDQGWGYNSVDGFFESNTSGGLTSRRLPNDRFRIFSYGAEAKSLALGALPTGGVFTSFTNLQSTQQYGPEHIYHSAQFRATMATRYRYWQGVMTAADLTPYNPQ